MLAEAGFGTAKEILDMDLLSFQSACRCAARVMDRQAGELPKAPAPEIPAGTKLTKDQTNLLVTLPKIKVKRG